MATHPSYTRTVKLVVRSNVGSIIYPTTGRITQGDISDYVLGLELENTTVDAVNNMVLTLRIDTIGTFIRTAPKLTDENTKTNYLIEAQITQTGVGSSKLFRFEIGEVSVKEDETNGEVLVVIGRGIEYALKETYSANPLYYHSPYDAFAQRLIEYGDEVNLDGDKPFIEFGSTIGGFTYDLQIPSSDSLKRDWVVGGPRSLYDHMNDIVERLSEPASSGGVLEDYFWDADPDPNVALKVNVFARPYGYTNSGVTIHPTNFATSEQKDKLFITDNKVYKNHVILRGKSGGASLPMDHTRFASNIAQAKLRNMWVSGTSYVVGDLVRWEVSGQDRFFKCKLATSGTTQPQSDSTHWQEDVNVNFPTGISAWTVNRNDWISNLANPTPAGNLLGRYCGFSVDFNFCRGNYSRNFNNEYENLTLKWVTRTTNNAPTGAELFHGQRILVGTSPDATLITDFFYQTGGTNPANRIATYNKFTSNTGLTSPRWMFSRAPASGDTISDLATAKIKQFNGTSWVDKWEVQANSGDHSWFHAVRDVQVVEGATTGTASAIEFTYDWNTANIAAAGTTTVGNVNKTSRGLWLNFFFPFPRLYDGTANTGHTDIGHEYGGTLAPFGYLDMINLSHASDGSVGWNNGLKSEDMGNIRGVSFKIRNRFERGGTPIPVSFNDQPYVLWFVDIFDRIAYYDFRIRRNNSWELINIPVGPNSSYKIYHSRIEEINYIQNFVLGGGDFYLPEKEFTGIQFDWRFVKGWGIQWAGSYIQGTNTYNGNVTGQKDDFINSSISFIADLFARGSDSPQVAQWTLQATKDFQDVDFAKIALDEFYFIKDLYVNSDNNIVSGSRTFLENKETEFDYNSAKKYAQSRRERLKFFPQTYHIKSFGDVRVKIGQNITISGPKVPNGSVTAVVQSVKHVINPYSYTMEIVAIRKFVVP